MSAVGSTIAARAFSARARAFLGLHCASDTRSLIRNVGARVAGLEADDVCFPVSVNDARAGEAWICSPVTAYGDYAGEELQRLGNRRLEAMLQPMMKAAGAGLRRAGMDACVMVNNWLVSTNGYPDVSEETITTIAEAARARWPDRAIWFRSLNEAHDRRWIAALRRAGAILVPSRQVYLFEDIARLHRRHADLRKDFAWLRRHPVEPLPPARLDAGDYARIAELYALLYLRKYSRLNPDYTPALLRAWHEAGLIELHGLRGPSGALQAAVGLMRFGDVITSPIVGYDTARPRREGLYRLLAATVLQQALRDGSRVNLSAGVAHFKRQRGGTPAIEYSAVIADHLPLRTRAALGALSLLTRRIGVPVMRRYRL